MLEKDKLPLVYHKKQNQWNPVYDFATFAEDAHMIDHHKFKTLCEKRGVPIEGPVKQLYDRMVLEETSLENN